MEEKRISLPCGEEIFYLQAGQGPSVLLIHGNLSSSTHMVSLLRGLEDSYTVYAIDMPGFGASTYKRPRKELLSYGRVVKEWIEAMGLRDLTVCGWSLGGAIALELGAISSLDLVKKIFLIAPIGICDYRLEPISRIWENVEEGNYQDENPLKGFFRWFIPFLKGRIPPFNRAKNRETQDFWDKYIYGKNLPDKKTYQSYLLASLRQRNQRHIYQAIYSFNMTLKPVKGEKESGRIYQVKQEVLIVHGNEDLVVDPSYAQEIAALLGPRGRCQLIENGGHFLFFDHYEQVLKAFKGFLSKGEK